MTFLKGRLQVIANQKGQSSIEGAVMAFVCASFISLFFGVIYLLYASYWIEHIMYESLICQQERGQIRVCITEAQSKIHSILLFDRAFQIRMKDMGSMSQVTVRMKFEPLFFRPLNFSFSKTLRI